MLTLELLTVMQQQHHHATGGPQQQQGGEGEEGEFRLRVKLLPLRAYLDQQTLDFLLHFFTPPPTAPPAAKQLASIEEGAAAGGGGGGVMFFQHCEVRGVKLKLDHRPTAPLDLKALQAGQWSALLPLFPLRGVVLSLEPVLLKGVSGMGALLQHVGASWAQDVCHKQLHRIVTGAPPLRSVVRVGEGMADLVLLPVRQYRKDGNLLRGLRKGTVRCLKGLTVETLNATHKVGRATTHQPAPQTDGRTDDEHKRMTGAKQEARASKAWPD